jgi:23S rRNA (guanosine2251-2'-O)-methyltransferase
MSKHDYLFGVHTVTSIIKNKPMTVKKLFFAEGVQLNRLKEITDLAKKYGISIDTVNRKTLDKFAQTDMHQGVVAECVSIAETMTVEDFLDTLTEPPFLLVLDGVQDPHNLGACLRTAEAAGVQAVIVPESNSASLTPVARKVASGAAEVLPLFRVTNLARTLSHLKEKGVWLIGAAMEGKETVFNVDLKGPIAIVLGAEGSGLRRLTSESCDTLAQIPMHGTVASLNVSVATGIFLFEAVRQRA